MTTHLETPTAPATDAPRSSRRRLVAGSAIGLLLVVLLLAAPVLLRLARDPAGGEAVTGTDRVTVRNDAFDPPVVAVERGVTVTWNFDDGDRAHNVVGEGWSSEVVASGTYRRTFTEPGSHRYRCTLHWGMEGRVDVAP